MSAVINSPMPPTRVNASDAPILIDPFGRTVSYLRISVTDRCDLRCIYCMSDDMQFAPREQMLSLEEIVRIGSAFVDLGVKKIRITGGEPLIRKNVLHVFEHLGALPGLDELTLTTNATQLSRYATRLRDAGVNRINISLDSLRPARFRHITRVGNLHQVLEGIEAAQAAGFDKIKLNAVILKHKNHDEVIDLVEYAHSNAFDISFIEEMPLGIVNEHDRLCSYYSSDEILRDLRQHFDLSASTANTGGPSRYYRIHDSETRVGFISPHSHNFCGDCNRVRLTAEGRLLLCLGQENSVDLRQIVRGQTDSPEELSQAIRESMALKPKGHAFDMTVQPVLFRHMNKTGG